MKKSMETRNVVTAVIMVCCVVAAYSLAFADPPKFDSGGVKMVAPMQGVAGCSASSATPCNKNTVPDVSGAVADLKKKSTTEYGETLSPAFLVDGAQYKDAADEVNGRVAAKPYQATVDDYKEQLKSGVFKSGGVATGAYGDVPAKVFYPDVAQRGSAKVRERQTKTGHEKASLKPDERIYVLISASVPLSTLRTYAQDMGIIGNPNVRMVLRGFVGEGGMKNAAPTMAFIGEILNKDHASCLSGGECDSFSAIVDIDPNIFRRFNPEVVPAIVYAKGVNPTIPDVSEGHTESVGELDDKNIMMVYGDISLGYALDIFSEKSGDDRLKAVGDNLRVY